MILTIILGFIFGGLLVYASLNRFNVISGLAMLENLTVAKAIAMAIGVGVILLNIEIMFGFASFHVKPLLLGGVIIGGLVFGTGMAILGYCPGTLAVSLGEGSVDALVGIVGGLIGGIIFTLLLPSISGILGPNLGSISLFSLVGSGLLFYLLIFIIGGAFILISLWLQKIDKSKSMNWLYSGVGLAVLNAIVFSKFVSNRPIGASTSFPYCGDLITGLTSNDYYLKILKPGSWELIFLFGAFLAGLIFSLIKKEFKFTLMHTNWLKHKGNVAWKRVLWSFIGGFLIIFGARMAGGCTSGHIISGGMQLAVSSLLFAVAVFTGLLITGKLFYK